jgi:hypothetical protein
MSASRRVRVETYKFARNKVSGAGIVPARSRRAAPRAACLSTARRRELSASEVSAGGGDRTHTPLAGPRILSPVRLPVPPPRREGFVSIPHSSRRPRREGSPKET